MEPLGDDGWWAAYSPKSRRSVVISNEAAAVLEWLREDPSTLDGLAARIASEIGSPPEATRDTMRTWWSNLIDTGLVTEMPRTAGALLHPERPSFP